MAVTHTTFKGHHHSTPGPGKPVYGFGRGGGGQILKGGKGSHVGQPPGKKKQQAPLHPRLIIDRAIGNLRMELQNRGFDPQQSLAYAKAILSQPHVRVGSNYIRVHGQQYSPRQVAQSHLANLLTGKIAEAQNKAAILADPAYQSTLANLTLQQQLQTAGLDDQYRRAVTDFGDAGYARGDAALGATASANPFSTSALLQQAYANAQHAAQTSANHAGTVFGGGVQSGLLEAGRSNAVQSTQATQALQDLLSGLAQQKGQAQSIFDTSQQQALQDTQQRLISAGAIHAAQPPKLGVGPIRFRNPRTKKVTAF